VLPENGAADGNHVLVLFEVFVPAFGMTRAAWIVFMGTLNYVVYPDIFQRRSANLPKAVATVSAVGAPIVPCAPLFQIHKQLV
jgi:hypothetical protein